MTKPHSDKKCPPTAPCGACRDALEINRAAYEKEQLTLAQNDASRIKDFVSNADGMTNHIGNAAYSITLFIKHIPPLAFNLLNGIPWLNMIFMIIGGMFRIANALFTKGTKKRFVIPLTILGIATMSFGIAGLVIFSLYVSLVLMAISAGIDLASSLLDLTKTTYDYFTEGKTVKHELKIALRMPAIAINIAALVGCVLLITMPPIGAGILIATAIATIGYIVADKYDYNPIKQFYTKYRDYKEEPEAVAPLTNNARLKAILKTKPIHEPRVNPEKSPWAPQKKEKFSALVSYAIKSLFSPLPRSTLGSPTNRPLRSSKSSLSPR